MSQQTPFRPDDLPTGVGLDDPTLSLTRPVDDRDHRIGQLDAPAQLVEYGDYECPFCAQALPGIQELLSHYGDRLLFVFRHFPLVSQHPNAWHAARAVEAAGAQDRFWKIHDHLLSHQHALSEGDLRNHASALGLDMTAFDKDLNDPDLADRIRQDATSGLRSGVMGTPTFFMNGRRLEGGFRFEELNAAIEWALAERR